MMVPTDSTLTLHSIEYVNVWFNLDVGKFCDYANSILGWMSREYECVHIINDITNITLVTDF